MFPNIQQNYGKYYPAGATCTNPGGSREYLHPTSKNPIRFFPSIGNHDWDTYSNYGEQLPYLQHFSYLLDFDPLEAEGQYYHVKPLGGKIFKILLKDYSQQC
jgi:hypothetical protein